MSEEAVGHNQDLVLPNEAFDRLIAQADEPAESMPELVELFTRHPKLPEA